MGKNGKLMLYIFLNILISAGTILLVMWGWEKTHPLPPISTPVSVDSQVNKIGGQSSEIRAESDKIPTTVLSEDEIRLSIVGAFSVGMEHMEYVLIKNESKTGINLLGWQIEDPRGTQYTFPTLTLNADGSVKVFSGSRTNSVIELYWGIPAPIWHSGDTVTLLDNFGIERAIYQIP